MFTPIKTLGQNFLKDTQAIKKMVLSLGVREGEIVIEIGPGLGAVTTEVMENFGTWDISVKAVEIDLRFVDKLRTMFPLYNNIKIVEANIIDWLPTFDPGDKNFRIIGSLPYYITSPIIHNTIKMKKRPESCVILIQKEVARRISTVAPDSTYMSSFVQSFFDVEYLATVDKKEFTPSPEVDAGILKLTKRKTASLPVHIDIDQIDINKYEKFLHKAYSNPRKMLNKMFFEDELKRADLNAQYRAQNYNADDWLQAFGILN
ncbi:ribosomal RNA small subunit methyltransferase A [candidate division WWE3 bacterium]|nr:ribosomal RNA small subunit methyltransferase A [candidate division WWE3 bacterium]